MLVRFSNANDCETCTQTVDFNKLRAIGMFKADDSDSSYFVRLSFDNGETYMCKENMTLTQAISYRSQLEDYWGQYNNTDMLNL